MGGECDPLPNMDDDEPISEEKYKTRDPNDRITFDNQCYFVNELYNLLHPNLIICKDIDNCNDAAKTGNLTLLKQLRAQNPPCPWNEVICASAARYNHLEILKWCRAQIPPCPWDEQVYRYAALNGHLEILKWCRAQIPPCPWDERTCATAALNGHLETLQWIRAQKPPFRC